MANQNDIQQLMEFSFGQVDANQAAQILKISNNDCGLAMNKMLDALEKPGELANLLQQADTAWDLTAFGGNAYSGYGPYQDASTGSTNPTFRIDRVDYANSDGPSAAPTRPPSRTSQRPGSALSTHNGDVMQSSFYSEDASWRNVEPLTGFSGVEPLTGFSGVETGQESGVVGSKGTAGVLRPATQDYYDSASWAVVPATKSTEYIPDAPLAERERKEAPGFIKPTVGDHSLPALTTILHTIPLIRNALLAPEITASNYWRGEDWWKGTAAAASITVDDGTESEAAPELEFLHEVQRLVAFLDESERTYASLDSLLQLDAWTQDKFEAPSEPFNDDGDDLKFLMRWSWLYKKHVPTGQLNDALLNTVNVKGEPQESLALDVPLKAIDVIEPNLYDYIDEALFTEQGSAHITNLSNVLILRLIPDGSRHCEVPEWLYADRYLEENRAVVEGTHHERRKRKNALSKLDTNIEKLKYHDAENTKYPKKMETLTLLKESMRAFEPNSAGVLGDPKHAKTLSQLQTVYQNVERKLSQLEEQKKKAKEELDEICKQFRAPLVKPGSNSDDAEDSSQHGYDYPYGLCGVAKSNTEYYLCYPDTWWHIKYVLPGSGPEDNASIIRKRVDVKTVKSDLSEINEKCILVYANDVALSSELIPLSMQLKAFVKKDTENLKQEIADAEKQWAAEQNAQNQVIGNWLDGDDGWGNQMNAENHYAHYTQGGSNGSSKTLTPDPATEDPPAYDADVVDIVLSPEHEPNAEPGPSVEMQEINGGIAAWAGTSNASSETVGADPMSDVVASNGRESRAGNRKEDVLMEDAEVGEPTTQHIEVVEEKGG